MGLLTISLFAADAQPGKTTLKVGDTAPTLLCRPRLASRRNFPTYANRNSGIDLLSCRFYTCCTKEMTSFASDIEKFRGANAEVLPTSTDNSPTLKRRAEELKASYIMLTDFQRNVSAQYGVLIPIVDWRTGPPLSLIRMGESSTLTRGRLPSTSVAPRDRAIVSRRASSRRKARPVYGICMPHLHRCRFPGPVHQERGFSRSGSSGLMRF